MKFPTFQTNYKMAIIFAFLKAVAVQHKEVRVTVLCIIALFRQNTRKRTTRRCPGGENYRRLGLPSVSTLSAVLSFLVFTWQARFVLIIFGRRVFLELTRLCGPLICTSSRGYFKMHRLGWNVPRKPMLNCLLLRPSVLTVFSSNWALLNQNWILMKSN